MKIHLKINYSLRKLSLTSVEYIKTAVEHAFLEFIGEFFMFEEAVFEEF